MEQLLLLLALQFLFVYLLLRYYESKGAVKNSRIVLVASLFFYFSVIALVLITRVMLRNTLDSFDLNHDGMFTGGEITDAQKEALKAVSSSTGSAFAPLIAIPYSLVYYLVLYFILRVFRKQR